MKLRIAEGRLRLACLLALLAAAGCDRGADPGGVDRTAGTSSATSADAAWTEPAPFFAAQRAKEACPHQHRPAAALRGDGALVAVWYETPDSSRANLLWSERPAGGSWSEPRPVAQGAYGYRDDGPANLLSMPDGSLVLAWRSGAEDPEAPRPLRIASLGAKGGTWRAENSPPGMEATPRGIVLAAGRDGLHIIWQDERTIRHSRRGADGTWSNAESLRPPGRTTFVETSAGRARMATSGFGPVAASAASGGLMVGWWDDDRSLGRSDHNMFDFIARFYDPERRTWSTPEMVADAGSREATAAAAAGANGIVLVSADAAGRLQARHRPFRGGTWSAAVPVPDDERRRAASPALARRADGRLLLTWRSFTDGGSNRLHAALSGGGAEFERAFSSPDLGSEDPMHGGVFNAAGAPMLWFNDPAVRAGCSGIAWSENLPTRSGRGPVR
jgi:hypothetical protein